MQVLLLELLTLLSIGGYIMLGNEGVESGVLLYMQGELNFGSMLLMLSMTTPLLRTY
jgi:hypothetical protein